MVTCLTISFRVVSYFQFEDDRMKCKYSLVNQNRNGSDDKIQSHVLQKEKKYYISAQTTMKLYQIPIIPYEFYKIIIKNPHLSNITFWGLLQYKMLPHPIKNFPLITILSALWEFLYKQHLYIKSRHSWEVLYQKQVSRAGTNNYIPQYLWDVISCPCPWCLLLAQDSWVAIYQNYNIQ